ncbi:fibronectin type III domain-containing protein [Bacteroidota bacterium]
MKYFKFSALLILLVSFSIMFNACEETTSTDGGPVIDSVEPAEGLPGDVVIIYGSGFGDYNQFSSRVYFGDEMAAILVDDTDVQWWDDEIQVIIPVGAKTGNVYVEVDGVSSNGFAFTVHSVAPPTNIMATSIDDKTIALEWTLSADDASNSFVGYRLFINTESPIDYDPHTSTATIENLTEGMVYTFDLYAIGTYGTEELISEVTSVQWSPASRFIEDFDEGPLRLYESASTLYGSGLQLYNTEDEAPKNLKVAGGDDWDLGLYTSGGVIEFGSAANILAQYSSYSGTPKKCEISSTYYEVSSLSEVYDSQALDLGHEFSEGIIDLEALNTMMNVVFIVRTNSPEWNYAKVMVINNGGFLQGTADNRYIEVEVSYQKVSGVPYAL